MVATIVGRPRAATYSRVSSARQEEEGTSLETQGAANTRHAQERGYGVDSLHAYRDVHSGRDLWERRELTRLREAIVRRELARQAGVAQRTVVEAEAGRQVPHPRTMRKLAGALGVDPTEIDEFRAAIEAAVEKKAAA